MAYISQITLKFGEIWDNRPSLHRLLPLIGGLLLGLLAEYIIYRPTSWSRALFLSWLIVAIVSVIVDSAGRKTFGLWSILFRPAFFVTWTLGLILFVATDFARHLLAAAIVVLPVIYWENLWRYAWARERYNPESLENISIALNTITTWFIGLLFYNLLLDPAVVQLPGAALGSLWLTNAALITTALTMASVYLMDFRTLWLQRYDAQKTQLWIITTTIIIGQIFFVINYLPNLVVVKALSLVFAYYLLTSIGRAHLDGNLTWAILKKYIYLSAALLLAIIITSAWLA